jgi:putative protease
MQMAGDYLHLLQEAAPDAILIQDLGLLHLCHQLDIKIPLHASTMMNLHNSSAARHLKNQGVSRIVCSRDIPLYEVARIKEEVGIEVEYFLHNDICISQGSICYLSGLATEKSSNRGLCIKPCRWQWDFIDTASGTTAGHASGRYLLAKKDLCLYHHIPELISFGIDCVKIEGRARTAEYLTPIVQSYRQAIDRYYDEPYGYATDFTDFAAMAKQRVRNYTTNHAFKDPGIDACAHSGTREPRIFSIVAEEKESDGRQQAVFTNSITCSSPVAIPPLVVRCGSAASAGSAVAAGADMVIVGGEFFCKNKGNSWLRPELTALADAAQKNGTTVAIASPRVLGRRESFEFGRLLKQALELGITTVYGANLGAFAFIREETGEDALTIRADFTWNIFNTDALGYLQKLGVTHATPSPELTFPATVKLLSRTPLPIELLVHGSIASMLLESCLLTGMLGHLSKQDACPGFCTHTTYGLRDRLGKIRQLVPDQYCRNHLLTEKDLCLLEVLPQVMATGAAGLRIEAQYYQPEEVGIVVGLYRQYLDRIATSLPGAPFTIDPADLLRLRAASSRPLSYGAYTNETVDLAAPDSSLPTDALYLYAASPDDLQF